MRLTTKTGNQTRAAAQFALRLPITETTVVYPREAERTCGQCRMKSQCLPCALNTSDIGRMDEAVTQRTLKAGESIFEQETPFDTLYTVRSGSVKTTRALNDGSEQVTGFHFPGDIIGLDGIYLARYHSTATALETSAICALPFAWLESLCMALPDLQRALFQRLSQEIIGEEKLLSVLGCSDADSRVASLLVHLSRHNAAQRLSRTRFRLSMARSDIASYLGLRVETVSRVLNRLAQEKLITIQGREVELCDLEQLESMAHDT